MPHLVKLSRACVQELIDTGMVKLNKAVVTRSCLNLKNQDLVAAEWTLPATSKAEAEDIPLEALYEDDDCVVINKPAGTAVPPRGGGRTATPGNALLRRFSRLSRVGGAQRPRLLHLLGRMTSGALVAAQ